MRCTIYKKHAGWFVTIFFVRVVFSLFSCYYNKIALATTVDFADFFVHKFLVGTPR